MNRHIINNMKEILKDAFGNDTVFSIFPEK